MIANVYKTQIPKYFVLFLVACAIKQTLVDIRYIERCWRKYGTTDISIEIPPVPKISSEIEVNCDNVRAWYLISFVEIGWIIFQKSKCSF